ncbi:DUF4007 family protein [Aneurinibacillus thermoaerophilus]|uniref:DUF4007 family protein n=1 Tax=Aneurinibacillus thermoaerophilus TaxID=143495 RepID=UPI002E2322B6|nr:DUF4007 family protein [Aneurinibacillus thermoaerophilus]MED0760914.1 DUF4007 family protein [Aneurinibacillus thermoaerophilus]
MGYGQHQSFYLRPHWIAKAVRMLEQDERFFYDPFGFEKIGLGKNMIKSLRFWTVAMNIVHEERSADTKQTIHRLTPFSKLLYEYDRFIRYPETAAILHYYLVSSPSQATTWYWFFNLLGEKAMTVQELHESLVSWVNQNENRTVSNNSLKRDIDCLIKLYTAGKDEGDDPEEVIQSPLHILGLVEERQEVVYKHSPSFEEIGLPALLYTLLLYAKEREITTVSVEEIQEVPGLWGKVFNMKRNEIVSALDELTRYGKYPVRFVRTNRIDSVRLPDVEPLTFLTFEYGRKAVTL